MNDNRKLKQLEGTFDPPGDPAPVVFRTVRGKKTLHEWIRSQLIRDDMDGFVTSIVLEHQIAPNTYEVHHVVTLGQANADPLELGKLFWDIAETFCQDLSGNHYFRLLVFWNNSPERGAVHPFVVGGQINPQLLAADVVNEKGLLQSGMHYAHLTQDLSLRNMDSLLTRANEMMMVMSSSQAKLMDENQKAYEACKTLLLDQERNAHVNKMEEQKYIRSTAERKELLGMFMPAVNALTGKEVFQYSASDTKLMEMLVDLPEDKLQTVIETVSENNPKLFALLMSRFHALANTKQLPAKSEESVSGKQSPETEFGSQSSVISQNEEDSRQSSVVSPTEKSDPPLTDNRQPITENPSKKDLVNAFLDMSEEELLETIKNDPKLVAKFKARMPKKKPPAKGKSNAK
jgi:hypothetical protein